MRDARNATYRHSRTAPRINNVGVPVVEEQAREKEMLEETRRKIKKKKQKKMKKKKRERRGKVERRATRGAASGAGRGSDVYPGRPLFPRCPPPRCPSSWSPMCPLHLRFLRRRSAPSAIRCCGALHLRYACSCCSDALTVASQPSPFSPIWRTEIWQARSRTKKLLLQAF